MKKIIKKLTQIDYAKLWTNVNIRTFVLLLVIFVLILSQWNSCQNSKEDKKIYEQNEKAYKKELITQKNKNGELQSSVEAWEGKSSDLEKYSKELAEELESVKKSKVKIISKAVIEYSPKDTVKINNTLDSLGNDKYKLNWGYVSEDSSRVLEGESHFVARLNKSKLGLDLFPEKTFVNRDEIKISLITGLKHNKETGFDEIFVTPKTSGVSVISIEGAVIDPPKKKKITVSAGVGYGVGMGKGNVLITTPVIAITIGKSIFSF